MSSSSKKSFRNATIAALLLFGGVSADAQKASVTAMSGKLAFLTGAYDLAKLGYQTDEFFLSGTASSYALPSPVSADGAWKATIDTTAPYKTRIVVMRPVDPAKFNGTVLVEWFNVTGGQDAPVDWMMTHRELIRKGYAYVGVTAQKMGVDGGQAMGGLGGVPLKKTDPARYGSLVHPGDAFSYDIYSQVGAVVKSPKAGGILGPLVPKRVVSIGESQSAAYLTTYINAVDPIARVFDAFLVHSRFGSGSSLGGASMGGAAAKMPDFVKFRRDLRVPVLTVITETDLLGSGLSGYHAARRPDDAKLRVWELAGAAHADNYQFAGSQIDSGMDSTAALAKTFVPSTNSPVGKLPYPLNPGLVQHYVMQAAVAALDGWLRTGKPPASTPLLTLATGDTANLARDSNGLAMGGVRTPWIDVPTIALSGQSDPTAFRPNDPAAFIARLAGKGIAFDKAALAKLYPGGKAEYLKKFGVALDSAIRAGHILRDDRAEIMEIAGLNFDAAT